MKKRLLIFAGIGFVAGAAGYLYAKMRKFANEFDDGEELDDDEFDSYFRDESCDNHCPETPPDEAKMPEPNVVGDEAFCEDEEFVHNGEGVVDSE